MARYDPVPSGHAPSHRCPYCDQTLGLTALDFDRPRRLLTRQRGWQLHCKHCGGHLKPSAELRWLLALAVVVLPLALALSLAFDQPLIYPPLALLLILGRLLWRRARFDKVIWRGTLLRGDGTF
ncbi:hypothetical protein [Chitinimonas lacunae]|uniref:Cxxc_20_cxxc protein n=1 Tax=Chitinimonas lacunae TaxID=1963018 RepID=A0ABV8MLS4_9NEIS